ncbi:MAG: hypothetical protein IH600_00815 [Bacteroidetes bacterium]|nr:hypothetical protein [Bacteroidota bacterium]
MPNRLSLLTILSMVVLIAACSQNGSEDLKTTPPAIKLYNVANARIVYAYGGAASGKKTHLIANYGMYQAQTDEMTFTMGGMTQDVKQLDIINDTTEYTINIATKEGTRSLHDTSRLAAMVRDFSAEEMKNFQEAFILRSQGQKIGKDTVLGKICDLYVLPMMGMRISMWEGLTLRSSITMGEQELTMTATEIDTDYSPSINDFLPPKDVKLTDPKPMGGMPPGHPSVGGGDEDMEVSPGNPHAPADTPPAHPPVQGSPH